MSKIQQQPETRKNKENSTSTTNQHKNQEKNMKSKIKLTTLENYMHSLIINDIINFKLISVGNQYI